MLQTSVRTRGEKDRPRSRHAPARPRLDGDRVLDLVRQSGAPRPLVLWQIADRMGDDKETPPPDRVCGRGVGGSRRDRSGALAVQ
ncbi:MAG: hypothetical protein ACTSRL_05240 [Candidatus Helarchaeota archaeon]